MELSDHARSRAVSLVLILSRLHSNAICKGSRALIAIRRRNGSGVMASRRSSATILDSPSALLASGKSVSKISLVSIMRTAREGSGAESNFFSSDHTRSAESFLRPRLFSRQAFSASPSTLASPPYHARKRKKRKIRR